MISCGYQRILAAASLFSRKPWSMIGWLMTGRPQFAISFSKITKSKTTPRQHSAPYYISYFALSKASSKGMLSAKYVSMERN
jgi:hypothetical protein